MRNQNRRTWGLALIMAMGLAGAARGATIVAPFTDTFGTGAASNPNFTESTDAQWNVAGGKYNNVVTNNAAVSAAGLTASNIGGTIANSGFTLSGTAKLNSVSGTSVTGMTLGFFALSTVEDGTLAANANYLADFNTGSGAYRILRQNGGANTTIATGTFGGVIGNSTTATYTMTLTSTPNANNTALLLAFEISDGTLAQSIGGTDTAPALGKSFGFRDRIAPSLTAGNFSASFDDFTLTSTSVPEPASLGLLGLGVVGLLARRRRRVG